MLKAVLKSAVEEIMVENSMTMAVPLDNTKSYILVLPSTIDLEAARPQLEKLRGRVNIVVIVSDNVRLLEF